MSVLDRFRLDGRTAILTGVGPGVGEHVAKAYAELGANVVISARSQDRLDRIAAEINALGGGRARAVAVDAASKDDLRELVDTAHDAFGPIHIVFNNAAAGVVYAKDGGLWANTDAVWQTAMDVNVMATWRLAELTETDMKAHGKGSIISVQSCGGFTPIPPAVAYGVSKAALLFLVRELAKTQAPHTRVNCLCVGSMSPDGQEAEIHRGLGLAERNAIKRFGAADEAVGAAILLASDASSYTTGSTIFTEGGRVGTIS
ncbi:NAD(P)-dependent dehydrogenase (short-subunit alcohol dehydrogenase family) [Sphingobium fontiphilum]|uniref:NAD(P)-dependent dehydrogenase (Short-subunit alcohol dehydrogenase family) n=1 Tax=Sphingobium fontiphilum TaxID=944425 RepID=A0A7W6DHN7_9SPHN|nr:SDR family oxidoreductase [Sphingobium fontiphilum]MBB3982764.1 NAD(P)-dependent dehydrogenase (short-subunit alcohol dehydrogenase family) [Sphingobium fontiphilum]